MRKLALAVTAILISGSAAMAADDPIAVREALMEGNGASAAVSGAMLKGDLEYNPAVAKAAIAQLHGTAVAFGAFFPEGSDEGDTEASPKIWEDKEGFQKALDKFKSDTEAAMKASGKKGPADIAAFKEAIMPVLGNCKSCHEDFRVDKD